MARNYFSQSGSAAEVLGAGQQGWDDTDSRINGMMDRGTKLRAGRQYGAGDRAGAARTLAQSGNIDASRTLEGDQRAEQDRGLKLADEQTARTEHTQDRAQVETQRKAGELKQLTAALRQVPAGKRAQFLQGALPILQQTTGMDVAPFQQLREEDLTDDHLATFDGEVDKHVMVNLGGGGVGDFRPASGRFTTLREPTQKAPPGFTYGPDGELVVDPGYVAGRRAIAGATRAPPRARAGGSSGLPPGY